MKKFQFWNKNNVKNIRKNEKWLQKETFSAARRRFWNQMRTGKHLFSKKYLNNNKRKEPFKGTICQKFRSNKSSVKNVNFWPKILADGKIRFWSKMTAITKISFLADNSSWWKKPFLAENDSYYKNIVFWQKFFAREPFLIKNDNYIKKIPFSLKMQAMRKKNVFGQKLQFWTNSDYLQ